MKQERDSLHTCLELMTNERDTLKGELAVTARDLNAMKSARDNEKRRVCLRHVQRMMHTQLSGAFDGLKDATVRQHAGREASKRALEALMRRPVVAEMFEAWVGVADDARFKHLADAFASSTGSAEMVTRERDQLRSALEQMSAERDALKGELDRMKSECDDLKARLEQKLRECVTLEGQVCRMSAYTAATP